MFKSPLQPPPREWPLTVSFFLLKTGMATVVRSVRLWACEVESCRGGKGKKWGAQRARHGGPRSPASAGGELGRGARPGRCHPARRVLTQAESQNPSATARPLGTLSPKTSAVGPNLARTAALVTSEGEGQRPSIIGRHRCTCAGPRGTAGPGGRTHSPCPAQSARGTPFPGPGVAAGPGPPSDGPPPSHEDGPAEWCVQVCVAGVTFLCVFSGLPWTGQGL